MIIKTAQKWMFILWHSRPRHSAGFYRIAGPGAGSRIVCFRCHQWRWTR